MCRIHAVAKRCSERKQRETSTIIKTRRSSSRKPKSSGRRCTGAIGRMSEIKKHRDIRSDSNEDERRKQNRMFHSDWLKKFDSAFDKMVYESDRV